ncbi:hypothetical protein NDU88_001676 [Pleurodeles waltl]|uniref:Uncharacterized protein n=1 Tax=Pleurodeles waltl TaxID=8319 RepID=A0AAV7U730_PLEWA|nr:hypothetical protein NDU88_001676 [Pleurodeles waltl]
MEWETMKVVIQGYCVSSRAGVCTQLLSDIQQEEAVLDDAPSGLEETPHGRGHLLEEQKRLFALVVLLHHFDYKALSTRAHAKQDKSSRMLAWLLRDVGGGPFVLQLRAPSGRDASNRKGSMQYYCDQYSSGR